MNTEDEMSPKEKSEEDHSQEEQPAVSSIETEDSLDTEEALTEERDETQRLKDEIIAMRDQWIRAVAETENVRKRARRDLEESGRYAVTSFARDMVSVLENLTRATENISEEAKKQDDLLRTLDEGVNLTRQELLNIFEKYGIKRLNPLGQKFDHNFHEAVVQVERSDVDPGTVIQVVQAGYVIHDRLLRPAMVAVSKQSAEPPKIEKVDTLA